MNLLDMLATWQDHREHERLVRQAAEERKAIAKHKQEVEHLCYKMFVLHYRKCPGRSFERRLVYEGIRIRIRAFFNSGKGEREIEIRAVSPRLDEARIIAFSELAKPKRHEWRPKYQFAKTSAPARPHRLEPGRPDNAFIRNYPHFIQKPRNTTSAIDASTDGRAILKKVM